MLVKLLTWFMRPRRIWCPTIPGWFVILFLMAAPCLAWCLWGEAFLSPTLRTQPQILVVEGWAGDETVDAAAAEFLDGKYQWVIAAGGLNGERWNRRRWTYAEIAREGLINAGVSRDKILTATARDVETQRTFETAYAVRKVLQDMGLNRASVTVFTLGAHGRRSHLVYSRVLGGDASVGVISWLPPESRVKPWWHSSKRAKELLTESVGWLYEALLESGRGNEEKQQMVSAQ